MSERVLYISPHLDDVVWSCPGDVMRTVAAGGTVVVATVFTWSDRSAGEETRKAEDQRAVQTLGAGVRHLDLVDAPWRSPWWLTDECGFADLMCGPLDDALVTEVTQALAVVCAELRPDRIVAPLGVGQHVDHRTVFEAAVELSAMTEVRVEFYEDRPYSFVDEAVAVRLRQLGVSDVAVDWKAHWSGFGSARYVQAFVSDADEFQRIVGHLQHLSPAVPGRNASPTAAVLASDELATAQRAMNAYGSQIDAFMDNALLARCANERRWRLSEEL